MFFSQINKLGDPVRRVAAKATYQIGLLLENHPAMKAVVLSGYPNYKYNQQKKVKVQNQSK